MEIRREVHAKVMKGLGPEWVDTNIYICLQVHPSRPEWWIEDLVKAEAHTALKNAGYRMFIIKEISKV